jgi:hypothetical protein
MNIRTRCGTLSVNHLNTPHTIGFVSVIIILETGAYRMGGEESGAPPPPGRQSPRGNKLNIMNKKTGFLSSANIKSLSQIKGSAVTDCDFS